MMTAFTDPELEAAYFAAYDAVMANWPVPTETVDLPGRYGTTRVTSAGPAAAPSLVLPADTAAPPECGIR